MSRVEDELDALITDSGYDRAPQSRVEAILDATINGEEYTDAPQSVIEEKLLELKAKIEEGGGGGTDVTKIVYCTQEEYDAMAAHEDDTLYLIGVKAINSVCIGDNVLTPDEGWDYSCEHIDCYSDMIGLDTGIDLFSSENVNRNWEIHVKVASYYGSATGEKAVFGIGDGSHTCLELYTDNAGASFAVYGKNVGISLDDSVGDIIGNEVIVQKKGSNLIAYVSGNKVLEKSDFAPSIYSGNNIFIGTYRSERFPYSGLIDYFKFKWNT